MEQVKILGNMYNDWCSHVEFSHRRHNLKFPISASCLECFVNLKLNFTFFASFFSKTLYFFCRWSKVRDVNTSASSYLTLSEMRNLCVSDWLYVGEFPMNKGQILYVCFDLSGHFAPFLLTIDWTRFNLPVLILGRMIMSVYLHKKIIWLMQTKMNLWWSRNIMSFKYTEVNWSTQSKYAQTFKNQLKIAIKYWLRLENEILVFFPEFMGQTHEWMNTVYRL